MAEGLKNTTDNEPSDDILRVEWCKSRARANRATEEVLLLKEEMRRTLAFLKWRVSWWQGKAYDWVCEEAPREGVQAYAEIQAGLQDNLHSSFKKMWETPLKDMLDTPDVPILKGPVNNNNNDGVADDDDDGDDLFDDDDALQDALDQDNIEQHVTD